MGHEEGEGGGGGGHELASVPLSESLPGKVGVASRKLYVHTVLYCTPRVRYCAAKAFYSCPAIISHRPESQKTPKEPQ
jgi:hypothetical protein